MKVSNPINAPRFSVGHRSICTVVDRCDLGLEIDCVISRILKSRLDCILLLFKGDHLMECDRLLKLVGLLRLSDLQKHS